MKAKHPAQRKKPRPADDIASWLGRTDIFASLDESELAAAASFCERRTYAAGQVVFAHGEVGEALFVVTRGSVEVRGAPPEHDSNDHAGGKPAAAGPIIAELVPGDCFGELEFLTAARRNASATAGADAELIAFPGHGATLDDIMKGHPAAAASMLFDFLRAIAGRIRRSNALIKENSPVVRELRRQVYGDKLTGLYNKTYYEERLAEAVKKTKDPVAVVMFKPDNFKEINDTWGHEAGDSALKLIAAELARSVPEGVEAFKYLGNELAVILPGMDRKAAGAEAARLKDIVSAIDVRSLTAGAPFALSFSFGVALYPDHGATAAEVIATAHELPLAGRARGGNTVLFPEDAPAAAPKGGTP